jgi:signal recognition particle receptor subunit alpha
VLFVGEALVGNDGVHQLVEFNRAMREFSRAPDPRIIDGIVLTKFDTIDDKVGAALSMVYSTGQPIVFVGTGQHYTNLKKLNVNTVVDALAN